MLLASRRLGPLINDWGHPMLSLHIAGGLLGILAGALALSSPKGRSWHRRAGWVFVLAMLAMALTAVSIATWWRPNPGNIIAGSLTAYLVLSGLMTVRPPRSAVRAWQLGSCLWVAAVAFAAIALAGAASSRPGRQIDGIPFEALIMFAIVAGLAAFGDLRLLLGRQLAPAQRLRRHLWRMGYALWVATTSLFLGQARQFPESWRESGLLNLPILLLVVLLAFEWWRAGRGKRPQSRSRFWSGSNRASAGANQPLV